MFMLALGYLLGELVVHIIFYNAEQLGSSSQQITDRDAPYQPSTSPGKV